MAKVFYTPRFKKQLTGTACGPYNCNMAACAMLMDRYTLGQVNISADKMRAYEGSAATCTDSKPGNEDTNSKDAARALSKLRIYPTILRFRRPFEMGYADQLPALWSSHGRSQIGDAVTKKLQDRLDATQRLVVIDRTVVVSRLEKQGTALDKLSSPWPS